MLGFRRITVSPVHCAIEFFDGRIEAITGPSVISRFFASGRREFSLVDVSEPEVKLANVENHLRDPSGKLAAHIEAIDIAPDQLSLVYKQERLSGILAPSARALSWKNTARVNAMPVRVQRVDLSQPAIDEAYCAACWQR